MNEIIGTFYFRLTASGNLLGEFTNNNSNIISTESAELIQRDGQIFEGSYNTTWFDNSQHRATLIITRQDQKFILNWSEPNNLSYTGEAILVDNLLIGYYRNN